MTIGGWLSLVGGILQVLAVLFATMVAVSGFKKAQSHIKTIRQSLEQRQNRIAAGVDIQVADTERNDHLKHAGIKPQETWDDVQYMKSMVAYLISKDAARNATLTVVLFVFGLVLSTLGDLIR